MNQKEIDEWKNKIDNMDQAQMASAWRFSEAGNPMFRSDLPLYDYFQKRFKKLGGMTPEISKLIGW